MFYSSDVSLGSRISYSLYAFLVIYYFFAKKHKPLFVFILLGILYFITSAIVYVEDIEFFLEEFIKYILLVICGAELAKNTSKVEFYTYLVLGSISIVVHALIFPNDYGRYSGFFIDPNAAGFVCLIGYCLSFSISSTNLKLIGQFLLTFAGILTFSRTFLLLWIFISLTSIFANRKNVLNFGVGALVIVTVLSIASYLQLNTVRFEAFESLISNKSSNSITVIQDEGYRLDTWSVYYNMILDYPFFGNGFKTLSGFYTYKAGVHNTFLMILGESGIFTFILFCFIYFNMLLYSFFNFKHNPWLFMLSFTIIGIMLTVHNYFENYLIVFSSIWLLTKINENKKSEELINSEILQHSLNSHSE